MKHRIDALSTYVHPLADGLIKQYRLRKAADLLRNSSLSVSQVIYETGFNSRSYFYKSFNEIFHCHPKDFATKAEC